MARPLKRPSPRPVDTPWSDQSRRQQRLLKEEILFETAARWFNRHGFHGTSLSDLANELGVTKAAIYHYVPDKSELLYRLHMRSLDAAEAAREHAMAEGKNGLERVHLIVRHYVRAITISPTYTFVLLEDGALTPAQSKEVLQRRTWLERDLREIIAAGVRDGSITPCDPKSVSLMLGAAMNSVAKWFRADGGWEGERVAHALSQMVGRMLATRPASYPLDEDVAHYPPETAAKS